MEVLKANLLLMRASEELPMMIPQPCQDEGSFGAFQVGPDVVRDILWGFLAAFQVDPGEKSVKNMFSTSTWNSIVEIEKKTVRLIYFFNEAWK